MANEPTLLQERLAALKVSYAVKLPERLNELEAAVTFFTNSETPDLARQALKAIHAQAHKLAGSAGTFGFAAVSDAAHHLDIYSSSFIEEGDSPTPEQCDKIKELLETLIATGSAKAKAP